MPRKNSLPPINNHKPPTNHSITIKYKPPTNSVTDQFTLEKGGSYYSNSSKDIYQLKKLPITHYGHEPRILYLQKCDDAHTTIFETNRVDWELTTRP